MIFNELNIVSNVTGFQKVDSNDLLKFLKEKGFLINRGLWMIVRGY